jgi:hypothetical protein
MSSSAAQCRNSRQIPRTKQEKDSVSSVWRATYLSKLDLPAPLAPSISSLSPGATVKLWQCLVHNKMSSNHSTISREDAIDEVSVQSSSLTLQSARSLVRMLFKLSQKVIISCTLAGAHAVQTVAACGSSSAMKF